MVHLVPRRQRPLRTRDLAGCPIALVGIAQRVQQAYLAQRRPDPCDVYRLRQARRAR